jgi:hypothetical protein
MFTTLNLYAKHFREAQAASMDKFVGVLGIPEMPKAEAV